MKNSKPDSGYLKKVRKKTTDLLKKNPKKFEDEDYHKLRVEIKKLKALATFIEFSHKHFSKKNQLKPFSKVYKQAGKVRELQLEEAFLKKNNVQFIDHYLDEMTRRIKKEKKKFASLISKKTRSKTKKSISEIERTLARTDDTDVIKFMNNERSKIALLTQNLPLHPQDAHKLRKILKEDFYTRKRIYTRSEKIKAEDDLLELLGKWHDCVVLNEQIGRSILRATIKPVELAELLKINASVSSESENLFSQINTKLSKGLF
jgi:CHAD domain-containing protein